MYIFERHGTHVNLKALQVALSGLQTFKGII